MLEVENNTPETHEDINIGKTENKITITTEETLKLYPIKEHPLEEKVKEDVKVKVTMSTENKKNTNPAKKGIYRF